MLKRQEKNKIYRLREEKNLTLIGNFILAHDSNNNNNDGDDDDDDDDGVSNKKERCGNNNFKLYLSNKEIERE